MGVNGRIWKEIRGDEEIFEVGEQSFRTRSSLTGLSPFVRLDPFRADNHELMSVGNDVAVEDPLEDQLEQEEDDWSDVSI